MQSKANNTLIKNNIFEDCDNEIIFSDISQPIFTFIVDNIYNNGIARFVQQDSGTNNFTVNETSSNYHLINLSDGGNIKFNYNGRKDFRVENNTITINNMPTAFNQWFNGTSTTPTFENFNSGTTGIGVSASSFVFSYLTASQPKFTSIPLAVTDMSYTYSGNVLTIGCTGTGNIITTNMNILKGTHNFYSHTKDGVLQGYSQSNDFTITDCSTHTFHGATPPLSFLSRISSTILRSGLAVILAMFILVVIITPLVIFKLEVQWTTNQWISYFIGSLITVFMIIILIKEIFNVWGKQNE